MALVCYPTVSVVTAGSARFRRGELAGLEQRDHLGVAGDILVQLAGLCEAKADLLWEDWQDAHNADFWEFRTLATIEVSASAQFEREFEMTGRCWIRDNIFYS